MEIVSLQKKDTDKETGLLKGQSQAWAPAGWPQEHRGAPLWQMCWGRAWKAADKSTSRTFAAAFAGNCSVTLHTQRCISSSPLLWFKKM